MSIIDPAPAVATRAITLHGGRLEVHVDAASAWPLESLCDFAARDNPRRGFLVVSRVLGRHLPATPAAMQAAAEALAARLPLLAGPVVFVGMAETAIALGQSVFAAWRAETGRDDAVFLHSTRQDLGIAPAARFAEPHSHAAAHLLYAPLDRELRQLLAAAATLVIVDDEVSSGATLANCARAAASLLPKLTRAIGVVLTDWSGAAAAEVALLRGRLDWRPDRAPALSAPAAPPAPSAQAATGALGRMSAAVNYGRLGARGDPPGIAARAAALCGPGRTRLLVLGTGEFTYPPFLLARALAAAGHDVEVQATSRSPVHLGGAIGCALRFADNYATQVPNFLYNVRRQAGRRVLICHETPPGSVDPALVAALDAECVSFA